MDTKLITNKKIYLFDISDEPKPQQRYRYAELAQIIYRNNEIYTERKEAKLANKPRIEEDLANISKIVVEGRFQKKHDEAYPNFMQIRWSFICVDSKAKALLDELKIQYTIIPVEFTTEQNHKYDAIFFNEIPEHLNLEASNLHLHEDGFAKTINLDYFSPIDSKIVLKKKSLDLTGIYELRESGDLICDEETKKQLEKSGLTGFSFQELEVN